MSEQSNREGAARPPSRGARGIGRLLLGLGKIIAGVFAALILAILVVLVFGVPLELNWAKGKIENAAGAALGRPFAIDGPLTVVPSFSPAAQIESVRIGNPDGWPEADLVLLDLARTQLRILPLLSGEILIEEIRVEGLRLNLEINAEGEPNWILKPPDEQRPAEKDAPPALRFIELAELSLRDIVVRRHDAASGKVFELELQEVAGSAEDHEPMQLQIRGEIQNIPYQVDFTAGSLATLVTGDTAWPMDLEARAAGARLTVAGEIAEPLRGRGLSLDVNFAGPSMKDLEAFLETRLPPIEAFSLKGRMEEQGGRYRIADLEGEIAATGLTGSFEVDTSGDRPRLLGNIDIARIDVGPLVAAIDAGERKERDAQQPAESAEAAAPGQAAGGGAEEPVKPAEKVDLDEPVLTLDVFERFDAGLELKVHEFANAPVGLRDAALAVTVAEGRLSAPVAVILAEVPFKGELSLTPEDGEPEVSVALSSEQSDIGELATWLTGAQGIEGRFDLLRLELTASGASVRSLVETSALTMAIADASLSYGNETDGNAVAFNLEEADLRFPAADDSRVTAAGSLLGEAFTLELSGGTFIENFIDKRWPVRLSASGAGAKLSVDGVLRRADGGAGSKVAFALQGGRFGDLAAWLGVSPQAEQAYTLAGTMLHSVSGVRIQIDEAGIGESAFSGDAGLRRMEDGTRITFADIDFEVLNLKGLTTLFTEKTDEDKASPKPRETGKEALRVDVPILPQGIEIFDSDIDVSIARLEVEPTPVTDVSVSSQIRDGHVGQAPIVAVIAGNRFEGGFGIDLRGEVPKIDLGVRSDKVDVGALLDELRVVEGLAMTAGGFELDIALEGASAREMLDRSRLMVGIKDGAWDVWAPGADKALSIRIPTASIGAEPGEPITLAIDGFIDRTPLQIEMTTDPLGTFAVPKEKLEMDLLVALARAEIKLTGAAPLPVQADNLHFTMTFGGGRLSDFNELLDADLPPVGPYRLQGGFGSRSTGFYIDGLVLSVGDSTLTGRLDLKTAAKPPRLDVALVAKRIQLDDFDTGDWSASGGGGEAEGCKDMPAEEARGTGRRASGRALLSPEVMRSLNAKLDVKVDQVLSGRDELGRGVMVATLQNGRFSVEPLTLDLPGGSADVSFALEPTGSAVLLDASAKIERLDYGILARRIDPEAETGGVISLDLNLETQGPDLAHVMTGANGHLDFGIWPQDLNAGLFELWAVNVIAALMKEMDKENASKVNCVIVRFGVDDGLMQERVVYADTTKMRVEGRAEVNFRNRTLDVWVKPKAKRPEFFSLAVPVGLSGAFDDFGLDVNPFILTGKAIALVTSPIHVPIRRVFRKGAPPDGGKACAKAWRTTVFHADPGEAGEASLGDDSSGETTPEKAPKTRKTYKEQPESILDEIN